MMNPETAKTLNIFIAEWQASLERNKDVYIRLKDVSEAQDGATLDFIPRPGVTYSLRAGHTDQKNRELFVMNTDGSGKLQLTETPQNEFNAVWHPDGSRIVYLSSASGEVQAWIMNGDGSGKKQISEVEGGIGGLAFSPDALKTMVGRLASLRMKCSRLIESMPRCDVFLR